MGVLASDAGCMGSPHCLPGIWVFKMEWHGSGQVALDQGAWVLILAPDSPAGWHLGNYQTVMSPFHHLWSGDHAHSTQCGEQCRTNEQLWALAIPGLFLYLFPPCPSPFYSLVPIWEHKFIQSPQDSRQSVLSLSTQHAREGEKSHFLIALTLITCAFWKSKKSH
jgi:hypothetical protein